MKKKTILAFLPLLLSIPGVQAQESPDEAFLLPEVVVTATRTSREVKAVPAAVEVIDKADIEARGAQTLKDIIGTAAGVSVMRSGGKNAVSIRGFDSRFSMILIDGKRIASEIDQNYELERIGLDNVERIEIVRGPVNSLYGTDALGGVVNIITKSPVEQAFSLRLDHGAYSGNEGARDNYHFSYDSGRIGRYGVTVSGAQLNNDKALKDDGTTYAPFGKRNYFNTRVDYHVSENEAFTFTAAYMSEDTREQVVKETPAGKIKTGVHDDNERTEYALSYSRRQDDTEVFWRAYLSDYVKHVDVHNLANRNFMNFGKSHRTIPGFEGRLSKAYGDNHLLTFGGEYRPEKFRGTGVRTGKGIYTETYRDPVSGEIKTLPGSKVDINYSALYIQDEWQTSPKLLMVTSLRYDDSNKFDSNLSPKLGLTYQAADDLRLKLNISKGFRSPTPNQLYINSQVVRNGKAMTLIGNPRLGSEDSNSYELSLERDWGPATGKLTYFTNKVSNMIAEDMVDNTTIQYKNIAKATIQGVEAEVVYPLSPKMFWTASYTYLDAVNDTDDSRLFNRARHKIASRLTYVKQSGGLRANLWSETYSNYLYEVSAGAGRNKSYTLWNLNLEKAISATGTIVVGIDNLLNKRDDDLAIQGAYIHTGYKVQL